MRSCACVVFNRRLWRHLAINAKTTEQNIAKWGEMCDDFGRKKQRSNAKSGGTKIADNQHVGAYKLTRWSLLNLERKARFSSTFEDRFWGQSCYSSIDTELY